MTTLPRPGRSAAAVPVLMYHSIAERSSRAFADFVVPPTVFAEQMSALSSAGCHCLTMSELARIRASGATVPDRAVAVTFDDGFADFAESALPALLSNGLSSTLYVATKYVGTTSSWLQPDGEGSRSMLSWSAVCDLAHAGVECGAHSHSHPQLDLTSADDTWREVRLSKEKLEDRLQRNIDSFAYPYGYSSRVVRRMVEKAGFTNACIVGDLVSDSDHNKFSVPRLTVTRDLSPADLVAVLDSASNGTDHIRSTLRGRASYLLRRTRLKKRSAARASA